MLLLFLYSVLTLALILTLTQNLVDRVCGVPPLSSCYPFSLEFLSWSTRKQSGGTIVPTRARTPPRAHTHARTHTRTRTHKMYSTTKLQSLGTDGYNYSD